MQAEDRGMAQWMRAGKRRISSNTYGGKQNAWEVRFNVVLNRTLVDTVVVLEDYDDKTGSGKGRIGRKVMNTNRISLSAALIVIVCFFLPWIQVSCGASQNRLSGIDLAQDGHTQLWIIPLLMIAVLFVNFVRVWREQRAVVAIVDLVSGLFSAYLMNRERVRAEGTTELLQVNVTGWFWLGFAATLALAIVGGRQFLKRGKGEGETGNRGTG